MQTSVQTSAQIGQTSRIQIDVQELSKPRPASQVRTQRSGSEVDGNDGSD